MRGFAPSISIILYLSHNIYYEQDRVVDAPLITARYDALFLSEMISVNSDRFVGTPIEGDESDASSSPAPIIDQPPEPDCDASIVIEVVSVTPVKLKVTKSVVHDIDDKVAADAADAPNAIVVAKAIRLNFLMVLSS